MCILCLGAFIPYNQGKVCMIDTSTGYVYSNSSKKSGKFELLDGTNCTEYKLSPNNDGSSGAIPISVPFPMFGFTYYRIIVRFMYILKLCRCGPDTYLHSYISML